MIKAWLLIFLFDFQTGEFIKKREIPYLSMQECRRDFALYNPPAEYYAKKFCVTDDHYNGRSVDANVPLDF